MNPLVANGQKLIPSVTRVFSKARDLYVFLQAYQRAATETQPLVAFVAFYRENVKAYETPPLAVVEGLDTRTKAVPLQFTVPLSIRAGPLRMSGHRPRPGAAKAKFWRAPIVIIP